MKTNYHTHLERCRHAQGTGEDYVKSALLAGVSELGISDHAPFPDIDFGMRMPFSELSDYLDELNALIAQYQSDIILWKGLEIEYLPAYTDYYEALLTRYGLDYLLLGEHFYKSKDRSTQNIYSASSTEEYIYYARTLAQGIHAGYFKAVAHPDLFMINSFGWDDNCRRASDIILDAAAATDTILEYNANGLRRSLQEYPDGLRYPYPHNEFWKMAAGNSIRVIVGSDAHNPKQVWDDTMAKAYQQLEELHIQPIYQLMESKH